MRIGVLPEAATVLALIAVIRAVVRTTPGYGSSVVGFQNGFGCWRTAVFNCTTTTAITLLAKGGTMLARPGCTDKLRAGLPQIMQTFGRQRDRRPGSRSARVR